MQNILIINPTAGKINSTETILNKANNVFGENNYIYHITEYPGHATVIAKNYYYQDAIIFSCGGDGTLFEIVQGIIGSKNCSVAVIPIGSGNDFIKSFQNIEQKDFSFEKFKNSKKITIDTLKLADKYCVNIASAGFDAEICAEMPKFRRIPLVNGSLAYVLSLIKCFIKNIKNPFKITIDDINVIKNNFIFTLTANGTYYGGGFNAAPYAILNDGFIDFVAIPSVSKFKALSMISDYKKGLHLEKYNFIEYKKCKKVRIESEKIIPFNVDGEIIYVNDIEIEVVPSSLNIIIPK